MEFVKHMPNPEKIPFENNVNKLLVEMGRLSNGSKDFILWELVRNSTRALYQIRLESLVVKTVLGTEEELIINIVFDIENNSLSVIDNGIGMTKADLVDNLCTITDPALQKYMDTINERVENSSLSCLYCPGYVGLGFFSAYMVAEKVVITTRQNGHDQYVWESDGCGSFTIAPDTCGDRLVRGTKVTLFLKKDMREYFDGCRLDALVANYPLDMCPYPISISDVGKRFSKRRCSVAEVAEVADDAKEKLEFLRKLFGQVLEGYVEEVVVSDRVYELPSNLSGDRKTLEINPRSKKIEKLRIDAELNPADEDVVGTIWSHYLSGRGNMSGYDRKHGTTYGRGLMKWEAY